MTETSLPELSAIQLLEGFASGLFTPTDLLEACLQRISRCNTSINALTDFCTERALGEAAAATRRWKSGNPSGLLDGLPIGVKDLQDAEGLRTTYGSPLFRDNVATGDTPVVARLRKAGAIVLAKTNVPEFGAGGNTRNSVWGATGNPFGPHLTAGGSSGGSAAALAASFVPLCTGSDTGGSLRLPAAFCGVVGYRPSVDVVAHPTRHIGWSVISVLGPMARNVDDAILMLRACHGYDADDPLSCPSDVGRFDDLAPASMDRLRLGYSEDFGGAAVDPAIREVFRDRIGRIVPHVASCRPVDLDLGEMDFAFDVLRAESFLAAYDPNGGEDVEKYGPHVAANVKYGRSLSLHDRARAHVEQSQILRRFNALMEQVDAILLSRGARVGLPVGDSHPHGIDGQDMDAYYRWLALTYRGSLMGGPSIALPAGADGQGMPFGLQILGRVRRDAQLLATAKALEAFLMNDPETAPLKPDLSKLVPPPVDLRSIAEVPLASARSGGRPADTIATAV